MIVLLVKYIMKARTRTKTIKHGYQEGMGEVRGECNTRKTDGQWFFVLKVT